MRLQLTIEIELPDELGLAVTVDGEQRARLIEAVSYCAQHGVDSWASRIPRSRREVEAAVDGSGFVTRRPLRVVSDD